LILISILVITASFLLIRKNIKGPFKFKWENLILLAKYSTGGALALIGISFLQNNDIILVKHLFNPTLSGIFGSASIVGRIIFFAASPVAIVMLPICAEKFKKGEDYIKPFIGTFALTIFIAGTITCLYWVMPELFTKTFFGEKYLPGAAYLPLYATFMMVFAVMNFVALFFIAVSEFKLASFTMAVFAAFVCLAVFMGYRKLTKGKFLISKAVVK
jgi:O-antigen/teichoic acid export membrane protein